MRVTRTKMDINWPKWTSFCDTGYIPPPPQWLLLSLCVTSHNSVHDPSTMKKCIILIIQYSYLGHRPVAGLLQVFGILRCLVACCVLMGLITGNLLSCRAAHSSTCRGDFSESLLKERSQYSQADHSRYSWLRVRRISVSSLCCTLSSLAFTNVPSFRVRSLLVWVGCCQLGRYREETCMPLLYRLSPFCILFLGYWKWKAY